MYVMYVPSLSVVRRKRQWYSYDGREYGMQTKCKVEDFVKVGFGGGKNKIWIK